MSTPTPSQIHLISKTNITTHHVLSLPPSPPRALPPSTLRLTPTLLSLTSTNLSYATRGHIFLWWDAYPITHPPLPPLPPPYNDTEKWGIVPSWGFAKILSSTVEGLEQGRYLYGLFPTISAEFELQFERGEVRGHWREVSPHRENLLTINNFYEEVEGTVDVSRERGLEAVFRCLWVAGFVLSGFIFGGLGKGFFHPGGKEEGERGEREGDLRDAVVVCLSAGGKTARAFSDCVLFGRGEGTGPKGYVAVTSGKGTRVFVEGSRVPTKTVEYGDIGGRELGEWIAGMEPGRVVVCDFGGRKGSYDALLESLRVVVPDARVLTIGIGVEPQVLSREENAVMSRTMAAYPDRYQINTSRVKDAVVERFGAAAFAESSSQAWDAFVRRGNLDEMTVDIDNGVDGIYRGWEKLIKGELKADTAMAFAM